MQAWREAINSANALFVVLLMLWILIILMRMVAMNVVVLIRLTMKNTNSLTKREVHAVKLVSTNVSTIFYLFLFKFSSVVKQGYFYVYAKPLLLCKANQVSLLA